MYALFLWLYWRLLRTSCNWYSTLYFTSSQSVSAFAIAVIEEVQIALLQHETKSELVRRFKLENKDQSFISYRMTQRRGLVSTVILLLYVKLTHILTYKAVYSVMHAQEISVITKYGLKASTDAHFATTIYVLHVHLFQLQIPSEIYTQIVSFLQFVIYQ